MSNIASLWPKTKSGYIGFVLLTDLLFLASNSKSLDQRKSRTQNLGSMAEDEDQLSSSAPTTHTFSYLSVLLLEHSFLHGWNQVDTCILHVLLGIQGESFKLSSCWKEDKEATHFEFRGF